jgi:F0F1-type ATP synthase membrane subunit b/b'
VLTAVVTHSGASLVDVRLLSALTAEEEGGAEAGEEEDTGPNPIMPEVKELAWGAGSFIVFALLMRLAFVPRLRKGMEARYGSVRSGLQEAEAVTEAARAEVADYEAALAEIRAEGARRVDAARQTLEGERQTRLAEVNARIAEQRSAAAAEADAARAAVAQHVEAAVGDVVGRSVELAVGRTPDADVVRRHVADAMSAGVAR